MSVQVRISGKAPKVRCPSCAKSAEASALMWFFAIITLRSHDGFFFQYGHCVQNAPLLMSVQVRIWQSTPHEWSVRVKGKAALRRNVNTHLLTA